MDYGHTRIICIVTIASVSTEDGRNVREQYRTLLNPRYARSYNAQLIYSL